jgi:hypothetical protein
VVAVVAVATIMTKIKEEMKNVPKVVAADNIYNRFIIL